MKTSINNRAEGLAVIEEFGANQRRIEELRKQNEKLRKLFEEWALAHQDDAFKGDLMEGETEHFRFLMARGAPALRVQSHLTREEVVEKLEADEEMRLYVTKTFDAAALKDDFARRPRQIEPFGLHFTQPQPHLSVEAK